MIHPPKGFYILNYVFYPFVGGPWEINLGFPTLNIMPVCWSCPKSSKMHCSGILLYDVKVKNMSSLFYQNMREIFLYFLLMYCKINIFLDHNVHKGYFCVYNEKRYNYFYFEFFSHFSAKICVLPVWVCNRKLEGRKGRLKMF